MWLVWNPYRSHSWADWTNTFIVIKLDSFTNRIKGCKLSLSAIGLYKGIVIVIVMVIAMESKKEWKLKRFLQTRVKNEEKSSLTYN